MKFATAAVSHAIPKVRPQGGSHIKSTIEMTISMGNCDEVMIDHGIAGFQATKNLKKQTKIGIRTFGIIIVYHSAFYPTYKPLLSFTDPEHLSTAIDLPC